MTSCTFASAQARAAAALRRFGTTSVSIALEGIPAAVPPAATMRLPAGAVTRTRQLTTRSSPGARGMSQPNVLPSHTASPPMLCCGRNSAPSGTFSRTGTVYAFWEKFLSVIE